MSNPYELRFRLLEMAQGYLYDQQENQKYFAIDAWEYAKEQGDANMELFKKLCKWSQSKINFHMYLPLLLMQKTKFKDCFGP